MSLRLRQAVAGRPTVRSRSNTCAGLLEGDPFIAYTSGSDIVLLDGEHDLLETLPFWSALPYRSASSSRYEVDGVIWDQAAALLVAWSGVNIVFWHRRVQHDQAIWVLHSALVASAAVTALSYQAGMLAVGHGSGLDLWKHDEKAAVVVWDKLWDRSIPSPTMLAIAPSLGHLAFFAAGERCVRIISISGKGAVVGIPQEMRHPRELYHIAWRKPRTTSGDPYLYTITVNSVMRIYAPVLDDPTWFQLHSTLDSQSFAPRPPMTQGQGKGRIRHPLLQVQPSGSIWPLDGDAVRAAILDDLVEDGDAVVASQRKRKLSDPVRNVLEGIEADEADLVLWVGADGVIAMRSILNMDRKPPTLLKSSLLAHTRLPVFGASPILSAQPLIVTSSNTGVLQVVLPAADDDASQSKSISSYQISLSDLISSKPSAVRSIIQPSTDETPVQLSSPISDFVRTPNGRGLLSIGQDAEIGVWSKEQRGKPVRGRKGPKSLLGRGHWRERHRPELCTIYAKGRAIVFYVKPPDGKPYISLQHLDHRASRPSPPTRLPEFGLEDGDEIKMLSAASDIDDGYSTRDRRTQQAVIIAVSAEGQAWIWRVDARKDTAVEEKQDGLTSPGETDNPDIRLVSHSKIPCCADEGGAVPAHVLPVDPMGWHQSVMDWANQSLLQDIVLTISPAGVLEFWRPRIGDHVANSKFTKHQMADNDGHGHPHKHSHDAERWIRTGTVHTERTDIRAARCSSRKKTVLVRDVEGEQGKDRGKGKGKMQEMTIWDSNVGEFSTGLEMCKLYPSDDIIQDLDWTTTSDLQSILAVGFPHRIELVCEQRMSYTEGTPGWATFVTIDMKRYCPSPIADSIWLAGGSLAVGCGNQVYLFSRYLDRETPIPTPRSSVKDVRMDDAEPEDVFQLVARQNGPVVDYHPTILAQCVLWDKVDLVKSILVSLSTALRVAVREEKRYISWNRLDPTDFIVVSTAKPALAKANTESRYDVLFNLAQPDTVVEEDDPYSASMVDQLTEDLANERIRLPLSRKERSLLAVLAKAVLEAAVQKRALDAGGLRYLFSLRMHVHELEPVQPAIAKQDGLLGLSHSASSVTLVSNSPPSTTSKSGKVARLSFRNIVWASHSESQEMMLAAATETCPDGKMRWEDAKRLGVFLWLRSAETVQLEAVARNRFMAEDLRDPTTCSLIFFALGKKKVVHGLWRQAPEHKEQNLMLKFLANDFELDRWKLAAKKNAYALLSKQRYEYAAAFFMLAGAPRDAINVVLRQMGDWQLAYALARAVETGTGAEGERLGQGVAQGQGPGPLVRFILEDTVIPMAFEGGHRWLATWAFWTLSRRDLAVQVLISPMTEVASAYSPSKPIETGFPENDDPSLLLLFSQLKSRSLQTAKGTAAISGKTEFDFVLHNARVFCRMGCHPLALALLREWSFERPELPERYIPKAVKARGKAGRGLDSAMATSSIDTPTSEDGNAAAGLIPPSGPRASGMQRKTSFSFGVNGSSARPTATSPRSPTRMMSYSRMRRPSFMLAAQNSGRRESMVADMEPEPESGSDTDTDTEESAQRQQNGNGSGVKEPYGSNGTSRTVATGAFPWDLIPEESSAKPAHIESVSPGSDTPSSKRNVGPTAEIGVRPDTPKVAAEPATTKKDPGSDVEDMPKKGMGNLMKLEQKGDVNQGAAEFSFDSFGF